MDKGFLDLLLKSINNYVVIISDNNIIYSNIPKEFSINDDTIEYENEIYESNTNTFNYNNKEYQIIHFNEIAKLRNKVNNDEKTGALSNDGFKEKIEQLLLNKEEFVLGIFDIDNFKGINDTYGHQIGDEILEIITNIFLHNLKESDFIGRFGGDEFMLVMPNITQEVAKERINDILKRFNRGLKLKNSQNLLVTLSMGLLNYDYNLTYDENFKKADDLLYQSKNNGKNQITIEQGRIR